MYKVEKLQHPKRNASRGVLGCSLLSPFYDSSLLSRQRGFCNLGWWAMVFSQRTGETTPCLKVTYWLLNPFLLEEKQSRNIQPLTFNFHFWITLPYTTLPIEVCLVADLRKQSLSNRTFLSYPLHTYKTPSIRNRSYKAWCQQLHTEFCSPPLYLIPSWGLLLVK